jgi:hypothetical protein
LDTGSQDVSSISPAAVSTLTTTSRTPPGTIDFSYSSSTQHSPAPDQTVPDPAFSSPSETNLFQDCTSIDSIARSRLSSPGQVLPLPLGSESRDENRETSTPQLPDYTLQNATSTGPSAYMCTLCNRQFEKRHFLK